MKTGFVLEGGAMRGMYTAGVLDVLLKNGISADCMVGVSAGALFGVNFLSGQAGRVIRYNKRFNRDKDYMGLLPLLREGNIVSTEYAYDIVPKKLDPFDDEKYKASGVPFYAVVTDVESGEPHYIQVKSAFAQMDVLRASASMPFVSKPVVLDDGRAYLDGGVSDSIPFEWMAKQDCDRLVVVVTRDASYRKKAMSKRLIHLSYGRKPKFAERLCNRHEAYNNAVEKLNAWEREGKAFVIRPSAPIAIGKMEKDPEKLQGVYDLGVRDAEKCLQSLRAYLQK